MKSQKPKHIFDLHRYNGVEKFKPTDGALIVYDDDEGYELVFSVGSEDNALATLPDTEKFNRNPSTEFRIKVDEFEPDEILGKKFIIPHSYDEENDEEITHFYYLNHEGLEECEVEFSGREESRFHIIFCGLTPDVISYDANTPPTKVLIDTLFECQDFEKWKKAK